MEITQQTVYETAALLYITLEPQEVEELTQRFKTLIEYFSVLDNTIVNLDIEPHGDTVNRMRDGIPHAHPDTHTLIECSEEHEDNYVLIPNVL